MTTSTDFTIYLDYSQNSHVLTGIPSEKMRQDMKDAKLATYHPRLYPVDTSSTKGWLIKKGCLELVEKLISEEKKTCVTKHTNLLARITCDVREEPGRYVISSSVKYGDREGLLISVQKILYEVGFTWYDTYVKPDRNLWFTINERSTEQDLAELKEFFDYFLSLYGKHIPKIRASAIELLNLFGARGYPENLPPFFYEYFSKPKEVFGGLPTIVREGPTTWKARELLSLQEGKPLGCLNRPQPKKVESDDEDEEVVSEDEPSPLS